MKYRLLRHIFLIIFVFGCVSAFCQSQEQEEKGFILFEPNLSNELADKNQANILDKLANEIKSLNLSNAQIYIKGYAAFAQNDIDPVKLSKDRAAFIINELEKRGVSRSLFSEPVGYGSIDYWGDNSTEELQKPNRRVRVLWDDPVKQAKIENTIPEKKAEEKTNVPQKVKRSFDYKKLLKILLIILIIIIIIALILLIGYYFAPIASAVGNIVNFFIKIINKIISTIFKTASKLPNFKPPVKNPYTYGGKGSGKYINGLRKNVSYRAGEGNYKYTTDRLGRIDSFYAKKIKITERPVRNHQWREIPGKTIKDDSGHLIADRLGGSEELKNLVAQNKNVNRGAYKSMENKVFNQAKAGKDVSMRGRVQYRGDSMRPDSIGVNTVADGKSNSYIFKNP